MSHHYKIVIIKKAEDAKYVTTYLNSYFIKAVCVFKMLKINFRNPIHCLHNFKGPKDFLSNLPSLFVIKFTEIIFKEKEFAFFVHEAKI